MRSTLLFIIIILTFSHCKKEETNQDCNLSTYDSLINNWEFKESYLGILGIKHNISLTIEDNYDYSLDFTHLYFDSTLQIIDSLAGFEEGKIEFDYCHIETVSSTGKHSPLGFLDRGDIIFSPQGKEKYTSRFEADNSHLIIYTVRLDTFNVSLGFPN